MKVSYIKFKLFITGLYGWGKGWLAEDYPSRWADMCRRLHDGEGKMFKFRSAVLREDDGHGACERFYADDFYAYMHPMEIAGHVMSSEYCPSGAEELSGETDALLRRVAKVIRESFPELELPMRVVLREYRFDTDQASLPDIRFKI